MDRTGSDRGLSKEATAALGFAATIALMATTGFVIMQLGDNLSTGGPIMSVTAADVDAANGMCCQRVRLTHEGGESVPFEDLVLVVTFSGHEKKARLHDLPTAVLDQGDYTGNHVFTLGKPGIGGAAATTDTNATFGAGDTIEFRISPRRVDLRPGETVSVTLRNQETGTVITTVDATVTG